MLNALRITYGDPRLRSVAIALSFLGLTYASTIPYQSIIATQQLGMNEKQFGLLIFVIGITGMLGNLVLGYVSDLAANRKSAVLFCLAIGALGFGLFALYPTLASFIICMLAIYPMANGVYSMLFGTVRSLCNEMAPGEGASLNSAVRSLYAVSWILMPACVGIFIAWTGRASDSFAIAALAFVADLIFYWYMGPNVAGGTSSSGSALANLREATHLVMTRHRILRLLTISLINSPNALTFAALPVLVTQRLHGTMSQLGAFAGLVAFLEIPTMLFVGYVSQHFKLWQIILAGGGIHAAFMFSLTEINDTKLLFVLAPLNAIGNAVLLTQHMTYAQDLLPDRPGFGSALLSLISVFARGIAALIFAGIGSLYEINGALAVCGIVVLLGCLSLARFETT